MADIIRAQRTVDTTNEKPPGLKMLWRLEGAVAIMALVLLAVGATKYLKRDVGVAPSNNTNPPRSDSMPGPGTPRLFATSPVSQSADAGVDAVAPGTRDGQAILAQLLTELQASGPDNSAWTNKARNVFATWQSGSAVAMAGTFSEVTCFALGCSMTMTFPDVNSLRAASNELPMTTPFMTWRGRKFRSGPKLQPSGAFEATWVIFQQ